MGLKIWVFSAEGAGLEPGVRVGGTEHRSSSRFHIAFRTLGREKKKTIDWFSPESTTRGVPQIGKKKKKSDLGVPVTPAASCNCC